MTLGLSTQTHERNLFGSVVGQLLWQLGSFAMIYGLVHSRLNNLQARDERLPSSGPVLWVRASRAGHRAENQLSAARAHP